MDRRRDMARHCLNVIIVVLFIADIIGIAAFHMRTSSTAMAQSTVVTNESIQKTTVPEPQVALIERTLENLRTVDGDTGLATAGFTLSQSDRDALMTQIRTFTDAGYSASFVVADINTGAVLSSMGGEEQYSASAIKGPYVMSLAATDTINLDAVMNKTDASAAQDYASITQAIQVSDNDAYEKLFQKYGITPMHEWLADSGVRHNLTTHAYLNLTAVDLAIMWTKIYQYIFTNTTESSDSSNKTSSSTSTRASTQAREWLVSNFANTLNSTIFSALGEDNRIMSKAGWINQSGYYALNDGGLVFPTNAQQEAGTPVAITEQPKAYVLAMLTDACGEFDMLDSLATTLANVYSNSMNDGNA